jgi:hypothetical protein
VLHLLDVGLHGLDHRLVVVDDRVQHGARVEAQQVRPVLDLEPHVVQRRLVVADAHQESRG